MTTAVVWSCSHADPGCDNERFSWLGDFIYDLKPDYVVDLGDGADMRSLNSFDTRYPKLMSMQTYGQDIDVYNDAQERLRHKFKVNKKRKPKWYGFEGNHEHRIKKALDIDPRLEGDQHGISFKHLNTDYWFDEYHEYDNGAPSIADYDGVSYAHFFSVNPFGTPISGIHHAYTLLQHRNYSSTCGHSHKRSVFFKDTAYPRGIIGNVVGCFKGMDESWAGQANSTWAKGVVVKRNIDQGMYDYQWISMDELEREYAT